VHDTAAIDFTFKTRDMKKILAAFDGLDYSESTQAYALDIARQHQAHLVGVFLEDITRHSYSVSEVTHYEGNFNEHIQHLNQEDKTDQEQAVHRFEAACQKEGIPFSIHRDRSIAIQELLHESIYADLLIIDTKETLSRTEEIPPTRFIRDLLSEVQCPVLIVPSTFQPASNVVMLFDGEPSSVFAVKMFSYVLASSEFKEIEVLSVRPEKDALHLPDNRLMKEFMKRHFPQAGFVVLNGPAEAGIVDFLSGKPKDTLVVLGAYRRSRMSRMFRPSMADVLMNQLQLPLFIAHNK
jgi:nucleotide-binding universal stress UspA family protein